jgi:serine protease Do
MWLSTGTVRGDESSGLRDDPPSTSTQRSIDRQPPRPALAPLARDIEYLEKQSNVLKEVIKIARPSVVHIEADKYTNEGGRRTEVEESGSGLIVRLEAGKFIVTNRHVVRDAALDKISIKLTDGRVLHPIRIASDRKTDIAIMQVDASNLTAAEIGDSAHIDMGDFVLAVGSPFGLSHSVTFGIVSAIGRHDLDLPDEIRYQDFIQTDAAINPGNSGGPLVNLRGQVVAVNTAIATNTGGFNGIGFAIPINMVMQIAQQLASHGYVTRSEMGVTLEPFKPEVATSLGLATPRGARIKQVFPDSPASEARLQSGDVVLEFDGVTVEGDGHLPNLVNLVPVGKSVPVVIFRDRKTFTVNVRLRELTPDKPEQWETSPGRTPGISRGEPSGNSTRK